MGIHTVFSVIRDQGISSGIWNSLSLVIMMVSRTLFSPSLRTIIFQQEQVFFFFLIKSYYAGATETCCWDCKVSLQNMVLCSSLTEPLPQSSSEGKGFFFFCTNISSFNFWRRKRLPTPVFWTGEHGLYSQSMGLQRVGHD